MKHFISQVHIKFLRRNYQDVDSVNIDRRFCFSHSCRSSFIRVSMSLFMTLYLYLSWAIYSSSSLSNTRRKLFSSGVQKASHCNYIIITTLHYIHKVDSEAWFCFYLIIELIHFYHSAMPMLCSLAGINCILFIYKFVNYMYIIYLKHTKSTTLVCWRRDLRLLGLFEQNIICIHASRHYKTYNQSIGKPKMLFFLCLSFKREFTCWKTTSFERLLIEKHHEGCLVTTLQTSSHWTNISS